MGTETEIKIKLDNPKEVRRKIVSLGAKSLGKKRQLDIYFDDEQVRETDQVRRLRLQDNVAILLDVTKGERRHYGEIFADFCKETGCPFVHEMTFEKEKEWLKKEL